MKLYKKREAIAEVNRLGYTVHYDTGACGDRAYGSRLYFKKPNSAVNEFGAPLESATISQLSGGWAISTF